MVRTIQELLFTYELSCDRILTYHSHFPLLPSSIFHVVWLEHTCGVVCWTSFSSRIQGQRWWSLPGTVPKHQQWIYHDKPVIFAQIHVMILTVIYPRITAILTEEFEGASYMTVISTWADYMHLPALWETKLRKHNDKVIQMLKCDLDLEVRSLNSQNSIVSSSSFDQLQTRRPRLSASFTTCRRLRLDANMSANVQSQGDHLSGFLWTICDFRSQEVENYGCHGWKPRRTHGVSFCADNMLFAPSLFMVPNVSIPFASSPFTPSNVFAPSPFMLLNVSIPSHPMWHLL